MKTWSNLLAASLVTLSSSAAAWWADPYGYYGGYGPVPPLTDEQAQAINRAQAERFLRAVEAQRKFAEQLSPEGPERFRAPPPPPGHDRSAEIAAKRERIDREIAERRAEIARQIEEQRAFSPGGPPPASPEIAARREEIERESEARRSEIQREIDEQRAATERQRAEMRANRERPYPSQ
jgi:hypothetical protein